MKLTNSSLSKFIDLNKGNLILDDEKLILLLLSIGALNFDDEIHLIKEAYKKNLYSRKWLTIKLLTTLDCNFNCSYCFEDKRKQKISRSSKLHIINYSEKVLDLFQGLSVAWFGGEPLLEIDSIYELTNSFKRLCDRKNKEYISSLTTNGYLLNKIVHNIDKLCIKYIQISLDGSADYHNKLRPLSSGRDTFSKIISNLQLLTLTNKNVNILLRINCTSDNINSIYYLLKSLDNKIRKRVIIYFKWIWKSKQCNYKDFTEGLNEKEQYGIISNLYREAILLGYKIKNPLMMYPIYCEVDNVGFMQISPDGNIHLCSETYSEDTSVGKLCNNGNFSYPLNWINLSPFNDPECKKCQLLPICNGGCRQARSNGKKKCVQEKINIEKMIGLNVLSIINQLKYN